MYKRSKKILSFASMTAISVLLTACGGSDNNQSSVDTVANEPVQITGSSWKKTQTLSKQETSIKSSIERTSRYSPNYQVKIDVKSSSGLDNIKHWQVLLNSDNDPKTGFQYEDEAWSKESGIDYIIEDGYLYKSTANDSSWSWKLVSNEPVTISYLSGLNIRYSPKLMVGNGVCKDYKIGFVEFDENWNIDTFFPKANSLSSRKTGYCNVANTRPTVKLNGAERVSFPKGSVFVDLGATAFDKEDGDITSKISKLYFDGNSNKIARIDTSKPGKYHILYSVKDSFGTSASIVRYITITEPNSSKVIDGEKGDWPYYADVHSIEGKLWIMDDEKNLYFMIESRDLGANTQVFIDTDNNIDTSYHVEASYSTGKVWRAGADIMIENNDGYTFTGGNNSWAWKWSKLKGVSVVRKGKVLEMSIPKATFKNSPTINIGFKSLDGDWNDKSIVTMEKYKLKY